METKDTSSCLDSKTKDIHAIQVKVSKAKEKSMVYLRSLHSYLTVLSHKDLKGTRTEYEFKREFLSLFGQDVELFHKHNVPQRGSTIKTTCQMTNKYFVEYTRIKVELFRDTLLQLMGKKWERINVKALDANLVVMKSSGTDPKKQDESNRKGNDTNTDDADIKPTYDEEPMAEVQLTAECNASAKEHQHTKQPCRINEGRVDQDDVQCQDKRKKVFANAALQNELRKLTGNNVDTKSGKPSILGKPPLQSLINQSVVRQSTALKSERPKFSKPRFASFVDVKRDLSKLVIRQ
ncbi:hypothetical protein Tco_0018129 [Tanacetum coccineum]